MADDLRAQLVKALWDAPYDQEDQADALLPLVRAYVDRRLREVADALERRAAEHRAEFPGSFADGLDAAAEIVRTSL